jgi:hypothetical protein
MKSKKADLGGMVEEQARRERTAYLFRNTEYDFEEGWRIPFRRSLDQNDLQAWRDLCNLVEEIDLENVPDSISWLLDPSGMYSTRSFYLELCKKPEVPLTKYLLECAIPLKIKIFTWQLARGQLPSNDKS